jgi:hypothetical protein
MKEKKDDDVFIDTHVHVHVMREYIDSWGASHNEEKARILI